MTAGFISVGSTNDSIQSYPKPLDSLKENYLNEGGCLHLDSPVVLWEHNLISTQIEISRANTCALILKPTRSRRALAVVFVSVSKKFQKPKDRLTWLPCFTNYASKQLIYFK